MAFSDYAQSQIVNQFQAYFQVKHAAYNDFLPEIDPNNLSGDPADPNSTLNQALEALRNRLPGGSKIAPDDPDYLQKMYRLASEDLSNDYSARAVLDITQEASQHGPEWLQNKVSDLNEERQRLEQQNRHGREQIEQITREVDAERAAEAERTGRDIEDVQGNYRNVTEIQYNVGVNVMKLDRIDAQLHNIDQISDLDNVRRQQMVDNAQAMMDEGDRPNDPDIRRTSAQQAAPPPPAAAAIDDSTIYFMNMIALNNPGISTNTQRVWDEIKSGDLSAGDTIDKYVQDFAASFRAANNTDFTLKQQAEMQEHLIEQVAYLKNLENSIQGIQPTPQDLADNFVESKVMPKLGNDTARVYDAMQNNGGDFNEAFDSYITTESHLSQHNFTADERAQLRDRIETEINTIEEIHNGVVAYESIELTPEATERIMRESWKTADIPQPADHYAALLQDKIAHYQSADGGDLDVQTASARAAVDIRAQIDLDRGVPAKMVVNENHTFYQNDIMQMEGWLKDEMLIEQQGPISPEAAAAAGVVGLDLSSTSALEFYSQRAGATYASHRRTNMEETMAEVYQEHLENPHQEAEPEQQPEPEPEPEPQPEPEPFVFDPGPEVMDYGEDFNINNPFSMTVPLAELDASQIDAQAANFASVLAFKAGTDGQIPLNEAVEGFHQLHDEDFTGMNEEQQTHLASLADEMGATPDQEFAANDPQLLGAMAAYANDMPLDQVPQQWQQAFNAASAAIETPAAEPAVIAAEPEAVAAEPEPVVEETTPHLTESFAADYETMFSELQGNYYDFLAASPMAMTMEQMQFLQNANNRFEVAQNAYEQGGDQIQVVQDSHDFTKFIRDGLEQNELAFVKDNWDQLHPYFDHIGEDVGAEDYEKGLETLRARQNDIIDETYNHRGAGVRELLRDRRAFDKIDEPFQQFDAQLKEIENLAEKNGIALPAAENEIAQTEDQKLQATRTGGGPSLAAPGQ